MCREANITSSSLGEETKGISAAETVSSNRDSVKMESTTHIKNGFINDRVGHISRVVCEELLCVEGYIVGRGTARKDVGHDGRESSPGKAVCQTWINQSWM